MALGTDFWLPIPALPALTQAPGLPDVTTIRAPLLVKARLRKGVTISQARAAMDVLGRRLATERPDDYGSGLGLSIVKAVAERHGGRVSVVSVLGAGSVFTLHLPDKPLEPKDTATRLFSK